MLCDALISGENKNHMEHNHKLICYPGGLFFSRTYLLVVEDEKKLRSSHASFNLLVMLFPVVIYALSKEVLFSVIVVAVLYVAYNAMIFLYLKKQNIKPLTHYDVDALEGLPSWKSAWKLSYALMIIFALLVPYTVDILISGRLRLIELPLAGFGLIAYIRFIYLYFRRGGSFT
jgi:hypothetical protein